MPRAYSSNSLNRFWLSQKSSRMKKQQLVFWAIVIGSIAAIRCSKEEVESSASTNSLAQLQKRYMLASSEIAKRQAITGVEEYYLRLAIPETLRQEVERQVRQQLDKARIVTAETTTATNVYRQETQLQNILQNVFIACARGERAVFEKNLGVARHWAQIVDAGTANHYWTPFCEALVVLTPERARRWLLAKKSERLAYEAMRVTKYVEAEKLAALSLQQERDSGDERLHLDIIQRLQTILHDHYSRHELSIGLAEKFLPHAQSIKYHLRRNGLLCNQAESLFEKKEHRAAMACLDTVIANAERFNDIEGMSWSGTFCRLRKIDMYTELGEFEQARQLIRQVEQLALNASQMIWLHIARSNLFLETGYYKESEAEIRLAYSLAEADNDDENRIRCLLNLGVLYARLSDWNRALAYYRQAQTLFTSTRPSPVMRLLILANIADILSAKNDTLQFEQTIDAAKALLGQIENPYREALLLSSLGNRYRKAKKISTALQYFTAADSVVEQNGFWSYALKCKIDRAAGLIALSRFRDAEELLATIMRQAEQIHDMEILIDAYDLQAQMHYREGRPVLAVASSQKLRRKIDTMSVRLTSPTLLMVYRQKIYDSLKRDVFYDLLLKKFAEAFDKLAQAKAYALKNKLNGALNQTNAAQPAQHWRIEDIAARLPEKTLLCDYLLMPDSLYVFLLSQNQPLRVLRKKINHANLEQTAQAYRDSIKQTWPRFDHYIATRVQAHYSGTSALSQQLYRELFGWPEINAWLQQSKQLYIVPDEFLHELPFSTLMRCDSGATPSFLIDNTAVSTLPSVSLLAATPPATNGATKPRNRQKKVLLCVDPQFPGAEQFVMHVKTLFPDAEELILHNRPINKAAVLEVLQKKYSIYIFIGHGLANAEFPEHGYITLSIKASNGMRQSIDLTVADLKTINWLGTEMVMLIGCETAGITLYRGTGISGLQQEFLSLGVKSVLGNLWKADATYVIPQAWDFLNLWSATGNAAQALQESQKKTLKTLNGKKRYYQGPHPYFWGSQALLTTLIQ